ncbi:hypothetical protein GALMADRAFT_273538 [Galerina marginata CBS 339.88]|uniref:DUF6533 domain-containing protein n=1 Tax=Galerina marginata (strain CBS 339.88) TaxID=685588 RepID=A0A067S6D8_GALM3|nr:hypothetical protein GALMADRAFT_273538 [Galerina marginata CBS 339.88]
MNWPPDAVLKEIWASRIASYVWLSGLVVLTYDTISTFPREVTHIWRKGTWSLPKMLYLLLRYLGLFQAIGSNTALLLTVNGIMVLRLYALYGRSTRVLCFLLIMFFGELAVQVFTTIAFGKSIVEATLLAPPDAPILGCLTAPKLSGGIMIGWSFSIVVAVICFIMTIAKFVQSALEARRSGWRVRFPPLAKAFVRDGTIYFLAVAVTLIAGAIICSVVVGPFVVLYEPWLAVSLVIAGSRLILNLREAAARDSLTNDSVFNSDLRGPETYSVYSSVVP